MTVVNMFWGLIALIGLSLVLQLLEPSSPPPEEEPEKPGPVEVPDPPREEGREAVPVLDPSTPQELAARLERVEDRLDIERRVEVRDAFSLERRP